MKLEIMMTDKGQVAVYKASEVNNEIGRLQKQVEEYKNRALLAERFIGRLMTEDIKPSKSK